eukprot:g12521.t1
MSAAATEASSSASRGRLRLRLELEYHIWYGRMRRRRGGKVPSFRTIMSYHCPGEGVARIPYFSNPDVSFTRYRNGLGVPAGVEPEYESSIFFFKKLKTKGANNAEVIRQNMDAVANFRSETPATPPPVAPSSPVPVPAPVGPPLPAPVAPAPVTPPATPPVAPPVSPSGCETDWVGNGYCDVVNNSAECNMDGGDCCACTCEPGPGTCTYLVCEDPYGKGGCSSGSQTSPIIPLATAPTPEPVAPSPPSPVSASCESDWIGNGYCDAQNVQLKSLLTRRRAPTFPKRRAPDLPVRAANNNAECNWDGGDCSA